MEGNKENDICECEKINQQSGLHKNSILDMAGKKINQISEYDETNKTIDLPHIICYMKTTTYKRNT